MNRFAAMLQLCLLAAITAGVACSDGVSRPIQEFTESSLAGAAGNGRAGSGAPRAGTRAIAGAFSRGGAGGGRSELQAGTGGPGDRGDLPCEESQDSAGEIELMEALNASIENKTFCPDTRGPGLARLAPNPELRCAARSWTRIPPDRRGGLPPGWFTVDKQTYVWSTRQALNVNDAKTALFGNGRGPDDHRSDLCAAAMLNTYKSIGVGHLRDTWAIVVSPYVSPTD